MAKILLIEDEEAARFALRRILEDAGHDVVEAAGGEEGVSKFKALISTAAPTDVVVTDILMPLKNGYETIDEIQGIQRHIKIIAISGGGGADPTKILDVSKNFLGVDEVLAKPFLPTDLLEAVNHCLA